MRTPMASFRRVAAFAALAGGTVVHLNAGVAGLVAALVLGMVGVRVRPETEQAGLDVNLHGDPSTPNAPAAPAEGIRGLGGAVFSPRMSIPQASRELHIFCASLAPHCAAQPTWPRPDSPAFGNHPSFQLLMRAAGDWHSV